MLTIPHNTSMDYFDSLVGADGKHILIGNSALNRHGLLTVVTLQLQCETPIQEINSLGTFIVRWYYSTDATNYKNTTESKCKNILVPTIERSIVEYIKYLSNFSEAYLIEALCTYLSRDTDLQHLYDAAKEYNLPKEVLDYWLNEARNETSE